MELKKQIIELEESLITAIKKSDIDRLQQLLHDQLTFTNHAGILLDKESDLISHRNGDLVISDIEISEQSIRIFDDVAVVVVKKHITGTYYTEPFESRVRFTRIWKKFNAEWKVISACSVPV
ncbi:nuclear transport factor 2 family protein [Pedobacter immunditicola]|uniref:nuclear transport factor 2 family protein n=1 Tax=Pedobacter immunditicola TaxID=3133440 RepID=UPI0030A3BF17